MFKKLVYLVAIAMLNGCFLRNVSLKDVFTNPEAASDQSVTVEPMPLKSPSSIIVCRAKQCAPAKISMSREYIFNSLFHLIENNAHKTALICEADPFSHICTESYIEAPIKVGVTPAHMYIDSVKIVDNTIGKGNTRMNLVLNYNVTFNGQTPDCIPAKSILYVKDVDHVIMEDSGYNCKMTTIGQTTIKTVFSVDYIDLDYGFIGGYYSIGASGPSYGGGTGYMLIRMPKDAYPLNPELTAPRETKRVSNARAILDAENPISKDSKKLNGNVQVFPVSKK